MELYNLSQYIVQTTGKIEGWNLAREHRENHPKAVHYGKGPRVDYWSLGSHRLELFDGHKASTPSRSWRRDKKPSAT